MKVKNHAKSHRRRRSMPEFQGDPAAEGAEKVDRRGHPHQALALVIIYAAIFFGFVWLLR